MSGPASLLAGNGHIYQLCFSYLQSLGFKKVDPLNEKYNGSATDSIFLFLL